MILYFWKDKTTCLPKIFSYKAKRGLQIFVWKACNLTKGLLDTIKRQENSNGRKTILAPPLQRRTVIKTEQWWDFLSRLEPSTLKFWFYPTSLAQKSELKMTSHNGFSSIIDLLKNYRIIQYFSLIIFMVLAKLSPCFLEISNMLQEHERSVSFTNSVSKFYKYFKVPGNCKKFQ